MSIRSRLTVLVALAAAPPLALVAYNTLEWRTLLERQAGEDALASARLVSAELSQLMQGTRNLMRTITLHPSVPANEGECAAHFAAVVKGLAVYREATLIDRAGRFHCSSIPIPPTLDVTDRAYFTEPLKTGRFTIGTITLGRVTGDRSLHVAMPYKPPDGSFDGIVVMILNPDRVAHEFAQRAWPKNHRVSVLDREGSVVFMIPPTKEYEIRAATRSAATAEVTARHSLRVAPPARTKSRRWFVSVKRPTNCSWRSASISMSRLRACGTLRGAA